MMTRGTALKVSQAILELPPAQRDNALRALHVLQTAPRKKGASEDDPYAQCFRDLKHRRELAGNPIRYIEEILGWRLTDQQKHALDLIEQYDRVLIPSGNNLGKTFVLAAYGIYRFDAVGALPDEERHLDEQGCQLLLPGPDHATIMKTIYGQILEHADQAERRGFMMPGNRSELSVNWMVRPRWFMEAFSPPKYVDRDVAHTASGRHHRNQIALVEEGQGVPDTVWKAVEGMCSGLGNKIISSFNPTEASGAAYQRARSGGYKVLHLDAFDHPNVTTRSFFIPEAVSYIVTDGRVRNEGRDRGAYPALQPDPLMGDFVYALPDLGALEHGPRSDGFPGHPDFPLHVYRPSPTFVAQVRGQWPTTTDSGLFEPGAWDRAVARWKARGGEPSSLPDRVGVDPAREGGDESVAAPAWGDAAESLLNAHAEITAAAGPGAAAALSKLHDRRAVIGEMRVLERGDGPHVALQLERFYPRSPLTIDEGSVGYSVVDHSRRVLGHQVLAIAFAGAAPRPTPGESWSENLRTAMYLRASMLVNLDLVDLPDDMLLREEALAHELEHTSRVVEDYDADGALGKIRKPSVALISKDIVKKKIGRSPDRSDAFVLALVEQSRGVRVGSRAAVV